VRHLAFVLRAGFSTSESDNKVKAVVIDSSWDREVDNKFTLTGCSHQTARLLLTFFIVGEAIEHLCMYVMLERLLLSLCVYSFTYPITQAKHINLHIIQHPPFANQISK
jgi:hypothetical protein